MQRPLFTFCEGDNNDNNDFINNSSIGLVDRKNDAPAPWVVARKGANLKKMERPPHKNLVLGMQPGFSDSGRPETRDESFIDAGK